MASPATPAGPGPAGPAPAAGRAVPGSLALRAAVLVLAAVCCGVGAWLGAWWVPFAVGLGAGLLGAGFPGPGGWRARRGCLLPAVAGAAGGWLVVLWVLALRGLPVGATGRAVAALAGLPPYVGVAVAATLLLAALPVLAGAWLARAVIPRREYRSGPAAGQR